MTYVVDTKVLLATRSPARRKQFAFLLTVGLSGVVVAEDTPGGVEEAMIVTGTRLSVESNPSFVTVIQREQIQAREPASVLELFRSIGGLNVSQIGGRGGVSTVVIRGSEPNFTVVLIDGAKVNDPNNSRGGSFDFSTLNVAEIERIEIVRGAMSSVYGSDALAGVINIITDRSGEEFNTSISAELGTDDYARGSLQTAGPIGANSQLSFAVTTTQEGEVVEGNDFSNDTVAARFSTAQKNIDFDLSARYSDSSSESFPEDSGGPEFAVLRVVDTRDQTLLTLANSLNVALTDAVGWVVDASYADHAEDFVSPGVAPGVRDAVPPNRTDSTLERLQFGTHVVAQLAASTSISAGVDFTQEDGKSVGAVELFPGFSLATDFRLERDIVGIFTELAYHNEAGVSLALALRHDDPDDEDSKFTSRVGMQYEFNEMRLFSNWGEGFKLPSFFALGHALVGNPNLRPETSTNWEVGVATTVLDDSIEFMVTGYRNEFEDLIDFDADLFTSVNRDEVTTQGFELSTRYAVSEQVQLHAHVAYTDVDIKDSTATLRHRPDWRSGLNLDWQVSETVKVRLDWLYQSEAFDSSVPTGGLDLDGYNRVDAFASWSPNEKLRVWISIDDLFDEDYQEAIGFPSGGLRGRIGLRYQM